MSQKKQTSVTSPRKFTRVLKLEVATRYLRGDGSYRSLSKELGVGKTQIFSWVHTFANEINANPPEAMKMSSAQPKKLENSSCHKKTDEVALSAAWNTYYRFPS